MPDEALLRRADGGNYDAWTTKLINRPQGTAQRKVYGAFTDSAGHRFIRDDEGKITEYPKSLRRRGEFSTIL